ncbi:MAG: hypothetical protein ACKOQ8_06660 [Micrococcales bacterium]
MSSRIEHPLGVGTGKPLLAKQRKSYTADEAIAAKAEIDELVVERLDRRTAAAMKGHITRKTVGYVSKPKQLLEQMIREARREHEDIFLKMSEPVFNEHKSMVEKVNIMIDRYGNQSVIYCYKIAQNVNNAKSLINSIISSPPIDIEMPSETVLLPLSRIRAVEDWLHESSIEPQGIRIEEHNEVQFVRFDFASNEDATLFRLRFL